MPISSQLGSRRGASAAQRADLLDAFGGMGSINDLMDDELRPLLSQIFTTTNKILRDLA